MGVNESDVERGVAKLRKWHAMGKTLLRKFSNQLRGQNTQPIWVPEGERLHSPPEWLGKVVMAMPAMRPTPPCTPLRTSQVHEHVSVISGTIQNPLVLRFLAYSCSSLRRFARRWVFVKVMCPLNFRAFRRCETSRFPSWTSGIRIPSPALDVSRHAESSSAYPPKVGPAARSPSKRVNYSLTG